MISPVNTRFEDTGDQVLVHRTQDVSAILDRNKQLQTQDDGYFDGRSRRRVATIPNIVIEIWKNDYGVDVFNKDHQPAVKRLLNSNEFAFLRTAAGQV